MLAALARGLAAAAAVYAVRSLAPNDATPVLAGTAGVAALAALSRARHLEGLAAAFGDVRGTVATVLVLLFQVSGLATCVTTGRATVAVLVAAAAGGAAEPRRGAWAWGAAVVAAAFAGGFLDDARALSGGAHLALAAVLALAVARAVPAAARVEVAVAVALLVAALG